MAAIVEPTRERGLQDYRKKLLEHKEVESRLKESESLFLSAVQSKCVESCEDAPDFITQTCAPFGMNN